MSELLKSGEQIDAVMCGNDRMAEQVLQALSEAGDRKPLVYSVDGSPVTKSALADPDSRCREWERSPRSIWGKLL